MKYFKISEFFCDCCGCGLYTMDKTFLNLLDSARELAGVPFRITSGFRCAEHNKKVGGAETSSHIKGLAADIKAENSSERFAILKGLIEAGFVRIGISLKQGFIHVDTDKDKTQKVFWTY